MVRPFVHGTSRRVLKKRPSPEPTSRRQDRETWRPDDTDRAPAATRIRRPADRYGMSIRTWFDGGPSPHADRATTWKK